MSQSSKIFFASDFHLGLDGGSKPAEREKRVVRWLKSIAPEARAIYLLGDIFDFWWEYKHVVPTGFTRFLGTISEITDSGIPVHFFTGNHDMWVRDYLSRECGMVIHKEPLTVTFDNKVFHLAHGEGLGSDHTGYRILLWIFRNKPLRIMYSALHPAIGMRIGHKWSLNSRLGKGVSKEFLGEEKEDLIKYANSFNADLKPDYFIFGHRHLAKRITLKNNSEMILLGDWIKESSYASWDGKNLVLNKID
ncbi:MAG: UDP-2,3-diacylglucosamine diphosphatase [Bacteroidales bacterium]|nr:UDP-2,3-diacylglucosamine diphosphatase [Bacteroidales bacterium]